VALETNAELDLAWRIFEVRQARFAQMGFGEHEAAQLAVSDRRPREVASEIAALLRKGCPPAVAREIVR
jgi:hypothetical protein